MSQQKIAAQVDSVRKLAKPCLVGFAKRPVEDCDETYLFASDRFCGLRIRLGPFEAIWRLGSDEILVRRGDHVLQTLSINGNETNQAAA